MQGSGLLEHFARSGVGLRRSGSRDELSRAPAKSSEQSLLRLVFEMIGAELGVLQHILW